VIDASPTFPAGRRGKFEELRTTWVFRPAFPVRLLTGPRAGAGGKIWCQGFWSRKAACACIATAVPMAVEIDGGERIQARALVIATERIPPPGA